LSPNLIKGTHKGRPYGGYPARGCSLPVHLHKKNRGRDSDPDQPLSAV